MAAEETTMRQIADLEAEIAKERATSRMALLRVERLEEQRLLLLHSQESTPLEDEDMGDASTKTDHLPDAASDEEEQDDVRTNWKRIAAKYGVEHEPRDHQLKALQAAMDGNDCIDVTGPGSGKTLAYLIAALYRAEMQTNDEGLSSSSSSTGGPVHLVVSATTDLGKQQAQELQSVLRAGNGGRVEFVPRPEHRPVADAKAAEAAKAKAADSAAGGGGGDAHDAAVCSSLEHEHKAGSVEAEVLLPATDIRVVVCLPEDLAKEGFRYFLQQLVSEGRLTQISLDEVHLVDQWAKFRGSYRSLGQHLAVVREGLLGDHNNYRRPTILCLTGTSSPRQAQALAQSLQLPARETAMCFSDLDRPHISYHVIDLNHMCDTLPEILKAGAEKAIDYIVDATKSIIFVATVREAYTIANFLNADKVFGITAFPFYSNLDNDAVDPKSGATLDREKTLAEFEAAPSGVLVSTTLGTHGLNFVTVDLVIHATIRSDVRTYYQDICRAGRVGNESVSVQIIHPLLLAHASWSVDFSNGEEISALRSMVRIASFSRDCRRFCTLSELGSPPPIPSSCQECTQLPSGNYPTCAACEADGSCTDNRHEVVDTTDAAMALLTLVKSRASKGEESWYTGTLRDSSWAGRCPSTAAANATFLKLIETGALGLKSVEVSGGVGRDVRSLALCVGGEKAADLLSMKAGSEVRVFSAVVDK
jgi:superfamily II DNA helicase RecQ